jgi:hypothetical protein
MDATEQLVSESEICAAVLGNGYESVLIPLDEPGALPEASIQLAKERGYFFAGVMGYHDGHTVLKCELTRAAADTMKSAAPAFAKYVAEKLSLDGAIAPERWVEHMRRLWELPDTRREH